VFPGFQLQGFVSCEWDQGSSSQVPGISVQRLDELACNKFAEFPGFRSEGQSFCLGVPCAHNTTINLQRRGGIWEPGFPGFVSVRGALCCTITQQATSRGGVWEPGFLGFGSYLLCDYHTTINLPMRHGILVSQVSIGTCVQLETVCWLVLMGSVSGFDPVSQVVGLVKNHFC
jgi:hypothetical protein